MTRQTDEHAIACDAAALERLRRLGGEPLVRDMVALFLETIPLRLAAAREGSERGDFAVIKLAARSMKSNCRQLGAYEMRDLAERVERAASALELAPVPALLDALDSELVRVRQWMRDVGVPRSGGE
ncbi:MAG: Hpt domain-containing protein [Gemmatimonadota bacterium]|nr:Hpt domain-containing protein [Gemmatimonadota bacterium]